MGKILFAISLAIFISAFGPADVLFAETVTVSTARTFAAPFYRADENTQIVLEGVLPSSCYQLEKPIVQVDARNARIDIQPRAFFTERECKETSIPWTQAVDLGMLPVGSYAIVVGIGGQSKIISVRPFVGAQAGDPVFAPVDSIAIDVQPLREKITVTINGRLPGNCTAVDHVDIVDHVQMIQLFPVLKTPCKTQLQDSSTNPSYRKSIELPWRQPGRYLVRIQSLDGQTINQVFEVAGR